jgi:hypothetical protein
LAVTSQIFISGERGQEETGYIDRIMKDASVTTTIPSRIRKIKNAICFFASEHERLTQQPLTHTSLHKYLSFLDFTILEKTGQPALGVLFRKIGKVPPSVDTHVKRVTLRNECFALVPEAGGSYVVKGAGKPDLECFSTFELNEMKELVETYADQFVVAPDIREISRRPMKFQKGTWADAKHKEVCAMTGLRLLTEKYVARLKELEAQLVDVQHKLDTVLEASRLLEEEGLSEESHSPFGEKTF